MSLVLFLSGDTMGDALGAIGRGYKTLFNTLGHDFAEVRLRDPNALARVDELTRGRRVELALTFVGMGASVGAKTTDGKDVNYWEAMGIPIISIYGDTPAYFFDRHVLPSSLGACFYAYPEHVEFRRTLPHVRGMLGAAAPGPMDAVERKDIDFGRKERSRLLFLKNGNDPDQLMTAWRESLGDRHFLMLAEIASELTGRMATDPVNRIDHAVDRYFAGRGLDVEHFARLRLFFVAQLDDYLRRVKSTLMAKVLMDFPVDMYGFNWEHLDFSGRRINFTPGGDYTASAEHIRDSLGVIDMSPNTSRAPHERALRAFGMYTLCITNEQTFFNENVAHADDFSFSFDPDNFRSKIADVIAHPKRYVEIGVAAAESFRERFSGPRFGEQLLDTAAVLRMVNGPRPGPLQPYFGWPPGSLG